MVKKYGLEISLHILFWSLCVYMANQSFAFESIDTIEIDGVRKEYYTRSYEMLPFFRIGFFTKALMAYINIFLLLPRFFNTKNILSYIGKSVLLILSCGCVEFILHIVYQHTLGGNSTRFFYSFWNLNALLYLSFYGISIAYAFGQNWQKNERIKQQLIQEKLSSELNYLKSQVNPHFLFNTLNNLFAIAERQQHTELSQGIADLSSLMRYMIYDCKAHYVPLEKEVSLLHSVIEIQQLRIASEDDVSIAFHVHGDYVNKQIAPLLLVPFVENAFKHGIRHNEHSFIKIDMQVENDLLTFVVINSLFDENINVHDQYSGIGLENVEKRLKLIYPDQHILDYGVQGDTYIVRLQLYLNSSYNYD